MDSGTEYVWSPPQYDLSRTPSLLSSMEIPRDPEFPENFARMAKWCPDGSTLLAHCENRTFQFFTPPPQITDLAQDIPESHLAGSASTRTLHQPSPILDFVWYPTATPKDPASFCFVASVRECPVKLLDAADGRLRASYRIVDHRERQIAPHSLAFNLTAEKLYCGFEDAIEVFDLLRPGEGTRLPTTPSKKSKDGLKGIISSLSFSPSYGSDFYAAGSLSPTLSNIAMFSESQGETPVMFVGGGLRAGVTQLHFNPAKPHILYASFRRHEAIYSWDIRADVGTPLKIFSPKSDAGNSGENVNGKSVTNQKMRFDVDISGRWLGVGNQTGDISLFDLNLAEGADPEAEAVYSDPVAEAAPNLTFRAHGDAVGSVGFHPLRPILASISGSRHFDADDDLSDSGSSEDEDEVEVGDEGSDLSAVTRRRARPHPVTLDASVKLWDFDAGRIVDGSTSVVEL